jgi:hypothetical protein
MRMRLGLATAIALLSAITFAQETLHLRAERAGLRRQLEAG